MSEWITDRRPTVDDACDGLVWLGLNSEKSYVVHYDNIKLGEPWMPVTPPEPYVKPKKYKVVQFENAEWGVLRIADDEYVAHSIPWNDREAAEAIAAIYEEMLP